jgi:hypothetical protein
VGNCHVIVAQLVKKFRDIEESDCLCFDALDYQGVSVPVPVG